MAFIDDKKGHKKIAIYLWNKVDFTCMRGKIISIFLIISIGIFSLISPVNAQNTDSIKLYEYSEGIGIAKSTGQPIAISMITNLPKTNAEMNKFINIDPFPFGRDRSSWVLYFLGYTVESENPTEVLILDSEGREIVRIKKYTGPDQKSIDLTRVDSDNKIIGELKVQCPCPTGNEDRDTFYSDTFKYAEGKKGKVQRLPQEKGLVSIKNLKSDSSSYNRNFVTISGYIRGISSQFFDIDDGTGLISLTYFGGFGDIKDGDKIFVKIFVWRPSGQYLYEVVAVSKNQITTSANTAKSDGTESAAKTPGFEVIIGVATAFFAWRKIISK